MSNVLRKSQNVPSKQNNPREYVRLGCIYEVETAQLNRPGKRN